MSAEVRNYFSCDADFDSQGSWVGDRPDEERPPGRDLTEFLQSVLRPHTPEISDAWNEEGYGWSFNCKSDGIIINVVVQLVDRWLIICRVVSFVPRFLRSKRYDAVLQSVADQISMAATGDNRFRDLRRFTVGEYVEWERKNHSQRRA